MNRTCETSSYALKIEARLKRHTAAVRGEAVDPNAAVPSEVRSVVGRIPIASRILDRFEPKLIRVPRNKNNYISQQNGEVKGLVITTPKGELVIK